MATAIYTRISSKGQDQASQLPDLERFVKSLDGEEVIWFKDTMTGKTMNRPGWTRLEAAYRSGKVTRVVVWRLDRLGRTASGLTALFDELVSRKINLVSIRDGIDLFTPAGRLMAGVLASVAQYETEIRSERAAAGMAVAREKGKHMGRAKGIHTAIKVTPEKRSLVIRLKGEGQSVSAIARTVSLSRNTVYGILDADHQDDEVILEPLEFTPKVEPNGLDMGVYAMPD
jgi:DNA invertase Pin-like site-specific DNA recombinase